MTVLSRRGACPTLSQPMQTGDGLIVRLNPIAGGFSPNALIGLCESALRNGNGIIEVTARGSLQVRGLTAESAPVLAREVDALGIVLRTGVPVETGPLAGLDPDEIADPRPLAEAIRAAIAEAGLSARLGPKVSVVVDGGGRIGLGEIIGDVRLAATRQDGKVLWHLAIGGNASVAKPLGLFFEMDAPATAMAILDAVAAHGPEGRARQLDPAHLAASRSSGNLGMPPHYQRRDRDHGPVGVIRLRNGARVLGIALPFGSMPAESIIALVREAAALGATEIRPAPSRALLFLGLSPERCSSLRDTAETLGFITDPADPRARIAACPGRPTCASGHIATREIALTLAASNADLLDNSFMLHVSGCAKGCARPGGSSLTLVGDEDGATLVVNGTAKSAPVAKAPHMQAARALGRVATLVRRARRPDESSAGCLARLGTAEVIKAFAQE